MGMLGGTNNLDNKPENQQRGNYIVLIKKNNELLNI
jgi:hypothetical protein